MARTKAYKIGYDIGYQAGTDAPYEDIRSDLCEGMTVGEIAAATWDVWIQYLPVYPLERYLKEYYGLKGTEKQAEDFMEGWHEGFVDAVIDRLK